MGLELFRPERDDQDPSYCLDEGFGPDFLQETVRRFSGNIGDFNKPDTYKDYEFRSFTLDIDSAGKSERPEWGEGKYQGRRSDDLMSLSPATMTSDCGPEVQGDGREGPLLAPSGDCGVAVVRLESPLTAGSGRERF